MVRMRSAVQVRSEALRVLVKGTFFVCLERKALEFVPLNNTVPIQHLSALSYLYAILMDAKIRGNDY